MKILLLIRLAFNVSASLCVLWASCLFFYAIAPMASAKASARQECSAHQYRIIQIISPNAFVVKGQNGSPRVIQLCGADLFSAGYTEDLKRRVTKILLNKCVEITQSKNYCRPPRLDDLYVYLEVEGYDIGFEMIKNGILRADSRYKHDRYEQYMYYFNN